MFMKIRKKADYFRCLTTSATRKNPVYDLDAVLASPAQRIKTSVSQKLQSDFVDHGDSQEVSFLIE